MKWGFFEMARGEVDILKEILAKLARIEPPIKKFAVSPEDPAMSVYFVELKDVCYITTKSDAGLDPLMMQCL